MTGSGVAAGATEFGELRIELRSVNGRSLTLKQRLCPEVAGFETAFDEEIRAALARGSVTLLVDRAGSAAVVPDRALLAQLCSELRLLARDLGLPDDLALRDVLALAATAGRALPLGARSLPPQLLGLLQAAIGDLQRHRLAEGAATVEAMAAQLDELALRLAEAEARAPQVIESHRERLLERVRAWLLQQGVAIEAADVVREVALVADRADVAEELQRLAAHLAELRAVLASGGAIGRKLEFLLQEVLREANTLGSKSPDVAMAHCVVAMKSCIDRLKEQAANLE